MAPSVLSLHYQFAIGVVLVRRHTLVTILVLGAAFRGNPDTHTTAPRRDAADFLIFLEGNSHDPLILGLR